MTRVSPSAPASDGRRQAREWISPGTGRILERTSRAGSTSRRPEVRRPTPRKLAVRIRRARLGDAAALARVQRASVRGLARGTYTDRQIALWTRLGPIYYAWALSAGGEIAFVAERGGRVVGFAALLARPRAEVTAVFVRPAAAGRGVGSALLARVESEARRRGIRRVAVKASLNGAQFYKARGYARARAIRVPLPDGAALDALLLTKALTAARTAAGTGSGGSRPARRAAGSGR